MKLIYTKTKHEVKVGNRVINDDADAFTVTYFRQPHKPSSEGKISLKGEQTGNIREFYVSAIGAEWIEREDRNPRRVHNEWFRTVSMGGRKSCPSCKVKLPQGESIWSWGEYHNAKWNTVLYFCSNCFEHQVKFHLTFHAKDCGCKVELVGYGETKLPTWLKLS